MTKELHIKISPNGYGRSYNENRKLTKDELIKEIARLNNIIDELEKELKEVYEEYIDVEDISLNTMAQTCEVILGKIRYLKELKEGK